VTDCRSPGQSPVEVTHLPAATPAPARPSFRAIYEEEFSYLWHTLRRLGTRAGDLEDTVHDVLVVVHRRLRDYDPARPLRPWLFGIAYRVASERRRRGPPEVAAGEDELLALPDHGPSPEAVALAGQARTRVHRALEELPLDQRAVMIMHDLDGCTAPEVAEALEIPLNTVYSRLRLARDKFVTALRAQSGGER
jgi:RNA polymerase sigma-70 factor (ECF subfamily)